MTNATSGPSSAVMTIPLLQKKKKDHQPISCLTSYDALFARILDQAGIDLILVGDSLGMTRLGYDSTLPVTMEEMLIHAKAVRRGVQRALLVVDMPYGSYQNGIKDAVANALSLVKLGGAAAVKIEGGRKRLRLVERLLDAEIPVMGHLGLTPQSLHTMGGYKVQGKTADAAEILLEDAVLLEQAGVFSLVLEGIPGDLARRITEALTIPTIGIGAGVHCDGQILVIDDMLGLTAGPPPKFVRQYLDLSSLVGDAVSAYIRDCQTREFPSASETYQNLAASRTH